MLDLYDELTLLIAALEERGVDYALCGGLALAIWAVPRATVDIDLLIEPESLAMAETVAESRGYLTKAHPMTFAGGAIVIHRISKIDPDGGDLLMLDLMLVTPLIADVWEGRSRVAWENGSVAVVSPDGLIKLKMFRGSGTDLDDIRRLRELE